MPDDRQLGLTRQELEREARWMLRSTPDTAAKIPEFLADLVVSLIDKNNHAIAHALARNDRDLLADS